MISFHNNSFATYIRQGKTPDGSSCLDSVHGTDPFFQTYRHFRTHLYSCRYRTGSCIRTDDRLQHFHKPCRDHDDPASCGRSVRADLRWQKFSGDCRRDHFAPKALCSVFLQFSFILRSHGRDLFHCPVFGTDLVRRFLAKAPQKTSETFFRARALRQPSPDRCRNTFYQTESVDRRRDASDQQRHPAYDTTGDSLLFFRGSPVWNPHQSACDSTCRLTGNSFLSRRSYRMHLSDIWDISFIDSLLAALTIRKALPAF